MKPYGRKATDVLLTLCLFIVGACKAVRQFPFKISTDVTTGRRVVEDLRVIRPPDRIVRALISLTASKMVMGVQYSRTQVFDLYNFRVRWSEPFDWRDNFNETNRRFHLQCWLEDADGAKRPVFDRQLNWVFTGYHEKFKFPPDIRVWLRCRVRAINSAELKAPWSWTKRKAVHTTPIEFPGVPGIDLRGWSDDDITAVLERINQVAAEEEGEADAPT